MTYDECFKYLHTIPELCSSPVIDVRYNTDEEQQFFYHDNRICYMLNYKIIFYKWDYVSNCNRYFLVSWSSIIYDQLTKDQIDASIKEYKKSEIEHIKYEKIQKAQKLITDIKQDFV